MTRGNQRELARLKNMKKQAEIKKGKREDNLSVEQRKQRDAEVMREKQRRKEAQSAARNNAEAAKAR